MTAPMRRSRKKATAIAAAVLGTEVLVTAAVATTTAYITHSFGWTLVACAICILAMGLVGAVGIAFTGGIEGLRRVMSRSQTSQTGPRD